MKRFLKNLFGAKTKTITRKNHRLKPRCSRLSLEALEERQMLAATLTASLTVANGILRIEGTYGADQIHIRHESGRVSIDGINIGLSGADPVPSVARSQITTIEVAALDGDDVIQMHDVRLEGEAASAIPMLVHGGMGNDSIQTGWGADTVYGEGGNDTILGGPGKDFLYGGHKPTAAQMDRTYDLQMDNGGGWATLGKNEKWLTTKFAGPGAATFDVYYITPDGNLYHYATLVDNIATFHAPETPGILVQTMDPSYHQDIRKLEGERGLYDANLYYGWGNRQEKWLRGIGNPMTDGWYFVTPVGELYRWDGYGQHFLPGMVSWYRGEGNAADEVGGIHGTLQNGATFAPGKGGQAFSFDGVSGFVEIPDSPRQTPASISIDAWINPNRVDGERVIFSKYQGLGNASWELTNVNGHVRFGVYEGTAGRVIETDAAILTTGAWQHVVGVFDLARQYLTIYVNGVAPSNSFVAGYDATITAISDSTAPVRIGAKADANGVVSGFWDGMIDEPEFFDRAFPPNPVADYWAKYLFQNNAQGPTVGGTLLATFDFAYHADPRELAAATADGPDDDLIDGQTYDDFVDGGAGNDSLRGGGSNDTLVGGVGNDTLFGGSGTDSLTGGDGSDSLNGGTGNDFVVGENDNDVIYGDTGDDTLIGCHYLNGTESGNAADTIYGGDGNDSLYGGDGDDWMYGMNDNDFLKADANNDHLYGNDGSDTLLGGAGDDSLEGGWQSDQLFGDDGNDNLSDDLGFDTLVGGNGSDTLSGGIHNDQLFGAHQYSPVETGDANDLLWGGTGRDTLFGGDGNDWLSGDQRDDWLWGEGGNDSLFGGSGNDALDGGSGSDLLKGELDNDEMVGGKGIDFLYGGPGNDTLWAASWQNNYTYQDGGILGLFGNGNELYGEEGDDNLYGGNTNDILDGGANNDGLFGGLGSNTLRGSDGADRFLIWSAASNSITDFKQEDARIRFVDSPALKDVDPPTGWPNTQDYDFNAGKWTTVEITFADQAFGNLHRLTRNTKLLELPNESRYTFTRRGQQTSGDWNYGGQNDGAGNIIIGQLKDPTLPTNTMLQTIYHEIGHSWGDAGVNSRFQKFLSISGWGRSPKNPGKEYSASGAPGDDWWYLTKSTFARPAGDEYSKLSPWEDYATTWETYFMDIYHGTTMGNTKVQAKYDNLDLLFADLRT